MEVGPIKKLEGKINKIDGKSYGGYKELKGRYRFPNLILELVRVQGDPFASPTLFSIEIDLKEGNEFKIKKEDYSTITRKTTLEDHILRKLERGIYKNSRKMGSGKSGQLSILRAGQKVLKRSAVEIIEDTLYIRFYGGLPANGRRINGRGAKEMLLRSIPQLGSLVKIQEEERKLLLSRIKTMEKAQEIREKLREGGYITFIENQSELARKSSVDERKLEGCEKFQSPKTLEVTFTLSTGEKISGMGIKKGITVITGGGFHGKSTLLSAIEAGVYNHIKGDGREGVITEYNSVKIRAEDGRWIENCDISNYINNLPLGKSTTEFTTENASGSVSQAANIVEALEFGGTTLLIDEDTTATNFMIRDKVIQKLIKKEKEPITPFIDRLENMKKNGISAIIVVGGLGEYFKKADTILMLDEYKVRDLTEKAKEIVGTLKNENEDSKEIFKISKRRLEKKNLKKLIYKGYPKIKNNGLDELIIDKNIVNLRYIEQLVEEGQVRLIGELIMKKVEEVEGDELGEILDQLERELREKNISELLGTKAGNLVEARKYEIGSAITRIRHKLLKNK